MLRYSALEGELVVPDKRPSKLAGSRGRESARKTKIEPRT